MVTNGNLAPIGVMLYLTVYVFDLPRDVQSPVLLINESDWVTRRPIRHENSIAHKKTTFQL